MWGDEETLLNLFRGSRGGRLLPEGRAVGAVDQGFPAFGRQVLQVIDHALDIVFPHLARQFVEELDLVPVGCCARGAATWHMPRRWPESCAGCSGPGPESKN